MSTPAAEQRKIIEQLMGKGSLSSSGPSYRGEMRLEDPRICKSFLVGECLYDLFKGTKQSLGRCPKIHLAKHKLQYERELSNGRDFPDFDREYFSILSKFVNDCNGQIAVALKNLEHTPEEQEKIKNVTKELEVVDSKVGLLLQEIQVLLEAGEVTKALMQSVKLQEQQKHRQEVAKRVRDITENVGQSAQQKLQVCEICGAYLSRLDTDRRLADHFIGKIHLGYVVIRQELENLKRRFRDRGEEPVAYPVANRRPAPQFHPQARAQASQRPPYQPNYRSRVHRGY
ncbi:Protein LUC7 [Lachancea thermotolerans]|uniref:KLTH0H15906p n=1 Tax=Lachancea thermotolerans (strain ATCC 56472 / CBS 6340 / NRRL Y-8284) TaxID=559295 RepID=C5E3S3_LACTC|nr:KLTH0H15906p [Lachancea thermotolerans CBS 6340]CAR30684.1 KLTH0H15906p [Lachancea thermotolerans CBS 6340]